MKRYLFLLCIIIQSMDCCLVQFCANEFKNDSNPATEIVGFSLGQESFIDQQAQEVVEQPARNRAAQCGVRAYRRIKENKCKIITTTIVGVLLAIIGKLSGSTHNTGPIEPTPDPSPVPDCSPNNSTLTNHTYVPASFAACYPDMQCLAPHETIGTRVYTHIACVQAPWASPTARDSDLLFRCSVHPNRTVGDIEQEIMAAIAPNVSPDVSVTLCTKAYEDDEPCKTPGLDGHFLNEVMAVARRFESQNPAIKPECYKPCPALLPANVTITPESNCLPDNHTVGYDGIGYIASAYFTAQHKWMYDFIWSSDRRYLDGTSICLFGSSTVGQVTRQAQQALTQDFCQGLDVDIRVCLRRFKWRGICSHPVFVNDVGTDLFWGAAPFPCDALQAIKPHCNGTASAPQLADLRKKLEAARMRAKKTAEKSVQRNQKNSNNAHALKRGNKGRNH